MTIRETCKCGAVLEYTCLSESDMSNVLMRFHLQHKDCYSTEGKTS
jgi:hypothetical protein